MEEQEELFRFPKENLRVVLEHFKKVSEPGTILSSISLDELVTNWTKFSKEQDGYYLISDKILEDFSSFMLSETLRELTNIGLVDISVNKDGEPVFFISDDKKDLIDKLLNSRGNGCQDGF